MRHVKAHEASAYYGVSTPQVRWLARHGRIPHQRTPGGHIIYLLPVEPDEVPDATVPDTWNPFIVYARVSSRKQVDDLTRQASYLQNRYPTAALITDVGSGINYERPGFKTILERLFKGDVKQVVVAHSDRFSRFGFSFFQWLFTQFDAELLALDVHGSDGDDLVADIMEIFTVFTARYHGRRRYGHPGEEVQVLPNEGEQDAS